MVSSFIRNVGAAVLLLVAQSFGALADKRVALVIGNSAYQNVPGLPNPINDATAIAELLRNAGFDVVDSRADLGIAVIRRAIREFADVARDADIAVVYYAGHGIEVDGTNYLIPVDAILQRDTDVEDEAISMDRLLRVLEPVKRLRLIILDACRENPFARSMKRTIASRAIGRGLAKVDVVNSDTLIAFSAKAGSTALDGDGKNSPFTTALLNHLATPGLDLRIAFGQVRDDVLKATANRQEPFVYGSLGGGTVSLVPAPEIPVDRNTEARRDYELFERGATVDTWDVFLNLHPTGPYADLARAQRTKLIAAEKARAAEEARAAEQVNAAQKKAAEQAKAAEAARLAEEAKAAEKAKLDAQRAADRSKAEQAEREAAQRRAAEQAAEAARIAAEAKAAEKARVEAQKAAEVARAEQAAAEKKAAEQNKAAAEAARLLEEAKAEKARIEAQIAAEKARRTTIVERLQEQAAAPPGPALAALSPPAQPTSPPPRPEDIAVLLQAQLKRVGCDPGATSGVWGDDSRRALESFNKNAGTSFDTKVANLDALEGIRGKTARVCPLSCGPRYRTDGDRCIAISCRPGFVLNDDGSCVRRKEPTSRTAIRHEPQAEPRAATKRAEPKRVPRAAPAVASREEGVGQGGGRGFGRGGGRGFGRGGGRGFGGGGGRSGQTVACGKGGCQTVVGSNCHPVGGRRGGGDKSTFGKVVCM
jgi:uncharacterized caspase-like protein